MSAPLHQWGVTVLGVERDDSGKKLARVHLRVWGPGTKEVHWWLPIEGERALETASALLNGSDLLLAVLPPAEPRKEDADA